MMRLEVGATGGLVMQCDRNYLFALAVVVAGLERNHTSSSLDIFVAAEGFGSSDRRAIQHLTGHQVHWLDIDSGSLADIHVPPGLHRAALSRFLLADALPSELERILYLDVDLLVADDLGALLSTPLGDDDVVGAVRDAYIDTFWAPQGPPLDLAPENVDAPYFNAGVILMDLPRWRREEVPRRCIELLRERRLPFIDQCAQNIVLAGRWKQLHPRWNVQTRHFTSSGALLEDLDEMRDIHRGVESPGIIHYTRFKPWQPKSEHPLANRWWELARSIESDIALPDGWAPPDRGAPSRSRSVRQRARRGIELGQQVARTLGLSVELRRDAELEAVRRDLAVRTGGLVAVGPFRGTRVHDGGEVPSAQHVAELLGTSTTALGESSALLNGERSPASVLFVGDVPEVVQRGVAHCWPGIEILSWGGSPGVLPGKPTLLVGTVEATLRWLRVRDLTNDGEAWILVPQSTSPSSLGEVLSRLDGLRVEVSTASLAPTSQVRSLLRELTPSARSALTESGSGVRWIAARGPRV